MVGVPVSPKSRKLVLQLKDKDGPVLDKVKDGRDLSNTDNGDMAIKLNKENILNNFWGSVSKLAKAQKDLQEFGPDAMDCKARSALFQRMLFRPPAAGKHKVNFT